MLTCKQVSKTLRDVDYDKLPPFKKFCLKLHVKLCLICGRYNRQVMETQDLCNCFKKHEEEFAPADAALDEGKKEEIKNLLLAEKKPGADHSA